MNILCICPKVSDDYMHHVETIALKGWRNASSFKRDMKRHERFVTKVFYGLGLLTIASIQKEGVTFTFIDENFEKEPERIYQNAHYDLIAITGQVIQSKRTLQLINYFKNIGIYVVVGGIHATTFFDDYIQKGVSIIIGEGEDLFHKFFDDFVNNKQQPLYQKDCNDCIDMKDSPIPRFSSIAHYRYNLIGIQTTRGCPYRCSYCNVSNILGEKYRHKPVAQVRDEILLIKKYWPNSMLYFCDDNLFCDDNYAQQLFYALRDVKLDNWGTHADISISKNSDLLDLLALNGSPYFAIGFETLSKNNMKYLGNKMKKDMLSEYESSISKLVSKGIDVGGAFMFGFPGDSMKELVDITEFIKRYNIKGYITRYSAIPGSELYCKIMGEYIDKNGPIKAKGTKQARIINTFFMKKNGYNLWDTENMIIDTLQKTYKNELPLTYIDALAVFRSFFL